MSRSIVWISGASGGLGAALAATVGLPDPHVIDLSRSGGGPAAEHVPIDLADPNAWSAVEQHFVARLAAFTGDTAVFVHNAGTLHPIGYAGEVDSIAYRDNVLLNSAAPQVLGHAFLRAVASFDGRADLVMVSSGAAGTPYRGWSSYGAAKAAVNQWVRSVGMEQADRSGARVLSVAPGVVATDMQRLIRDTDLRDFPDRGRFEELHAEGALVDPSDAARRLWRLLDTEWENGAVTDLRRLDK